MTLSEQRFPSPSGGGLEPAPYLIRGWGWGLKPYRSELSLFIGGSDLSIVLLNLFQYVFRRMEGARGPPVEEDLGIAMNR